MCSKTLKTFKTPKTPKMTSINVESLISKTCLSNDKYIMFIADSASDEKGNFKIYAKVAMESSKKFGQTLFVLNQHRGPIVSMVIDRKDKFLYSIDSHGIIITWLLKRRECVRIYRVDMYNVRGLILTKKNYLVAYGDYYDCCPCSDCQSAKYAPFHASQFLSGEDYDDYDFDPTDVYDEPTEEQRKYYGPLFDTYARHNDEHKTKANLCLFSPHTNTCVDNINHSGLGSIINAFIVGNRILFVSSHGELHFYDFHGGFVDKFDRVMDSVPREDDNNDVVRELNFDAAEPHPDFPSMYYLMNSVLSRDNRFLYMINQEGEIGQYELNFDDVFMPYYQERIFNTRLVNFSLLHNANLSFNHDESSLLVSMDSEGSNILCLDPTTLQIQRQIQTDAPRPVIVVLVGDSYFCYSRHDSVIYIIRSEMFHAKSFNTLAKIFEKMNGAFDDIAHVVVRSFV